MTEPKEIAEAREWLKKSEFKPATVIWEAKAHMRSILAQYDKQCERVQVNENREEINEDMQ